MPDSIQELQRDFATLDARLRGQILALAGDAAAVVIEEDAQRRAPKRTSTLARSIKHRRVKATSQEAVIEIGPQMKYGAYVEFGTGVHGPNKKPIEIKAKNARALRWLVAQGVSISGGKVRKRSAGNQYAFAKSVTIQGSRPQPYLIPAFEEKQGEASETAMAVLFTQVRQVMAQ